MNSTWLQLFILFKCFIDSHLYEHDGWHRFRNLNIINLWEPNRMQIVSRQGSLAWTEMQRSKELMWAALHACGFGLPRLWYPAHELTSTLQPFAELFIYDTWIWFCQRKKFGKHASREISLLFVQRLPEKFAVSGQSQKRIRVTFNFCYLLVLLVP